MVSAPTSTITLGTAQASTSGTSIDFTSIPSSVKRITVMLNGVSLSGSSDVQIQIGSGSITTTGYSSISNYSTNQSIKTTGFVLDPFSTSSDFRTGKITICLFNSNIYLASGNFSNGISAGQVASLAGTSPNLSGTLDRIRITSVNGTDTFDAGSVNIMYE